MAIVAKIRIPMIRKSHLKKLKPLGRLFKYPTVAAVIVLAIIGFYNLLFIGRTLPNIYIADVNVSGLTPSETYNLLSRSFQPPKKITLLAGNQSFELDLASVGFKHDPELTAYSAYNIGRSGNFVFDTQDRINALWQKRNIGMRISFDEQKLNEFLSVLGGEVYIEPIYPKVSYQENIAVVEPGKYGLDVDLPKLRADLGQNIALGKNNPIIINTKQIGYSLTPVEADLLKNRAQKLIGEKLKLTFEFQTFEYNDAQLFELLDYQAGYSQDRINKLIDSLIPSVEREPQNSVFVFDSGKVKEFAPAKPGVVIDKDKFIEKLTLALGNLESTDTKEESFEVAVKLTQPEITNNEVNDLGIKELIGRGSSTFRGSIASRVYNVNLAATRLNGVLIKPGEAFSFNNALGDVSKLTGYKEAYVIKDGKTVLGDGGGVCQVSTTLFRAALNAGLPIIERRAHAYRVGYYEQDAGPGLDATVYSPTTDLKFLNDTPAYILIQAYPDTTKLTLVFELYGTSDGRTSTVTKPVTSGVTPPPEDLYQDDPTLPTGVIKQIEHKAWGAKSVFNYTVTRDGQQIYQKTFVSNYRPWQAVYLRGTGPAQ